jgi:hypothetical protein
MAVSKLQIAAQESTSTRLRQIDEESEEEHKLSKCPFLDMQN